MVITDFKIAKLYMELKKPFITALRRVDSINDIIIKVYTDTKHVGYAGASPVTVITGTTNEDVIQDLTQTVFPSLIGENIDTNDIFLKLQAMNISAEAKACVDIALYDILAKQSNQSLCQFLGAKTFKMQTDLTISVNEPLQMKEDTQEAIKKGFTRLKIKLNHDVDKNIQRLKMINDVLTDEVKLRLDPNQALSLVGCLKLLSSINTNNIECIEQPFGAQDLHSMKELKDKNIIPVLADESIFNVEDAKKILDEEIADMLNIKLMKCAGIYQALKIAKLAKAHKASCMIGSMLEGPISLLAAAHFGVSQDNVSMADLDSPLYLKEHPLLEPFNMKKDCIQLSSVPGLGIDTIMDELQPFNEPTHQ